MAALSFIYLFGNQGALKFVLGWFGRRDDLRPARHGAGDELRRVSARGDDPAGRDGAVGRAALRGRRVDGNARVAPLPHHHAARRQVRPHIGGDGRVHDGGVGVRRAQGDRRQLPGAGDRHLQAGDRAAELPDGRRRRARAAVAGRRRVRRRPAGAAPAAGADDRAQRAVRAAALARPRPCCAAVRHPGLGRDADGDGHGGLRLVREAVAVQPVADARALHVRLRRGKRRARVPEQPRDGRLVRGLRRGNHVRRRLLGREDARRGDPAAADPPAGDAADGGARHGARHRATSCSSTRRPIL